MAEYFPILMGERPPLGHSFAFMKHLKVDPLKNAQGQAALATRFATSAKETVEALQVLARRAGASSGERQRPYETKDAIAIKVAAVNGDVRAKSMLGRMYFKGEGVLQDHTEAAIWLHGAAEAGDADAQGLLGMAYEEGLGVSRDYSKAAELYRKAAEQGIDAAAYFLGNLFLEGKGVAKDSATAAKWFLASAQAGNTGAQG
ncbi:hypothetical protein PS850_06207 [Pseudomonas fluorescens]|nr:hypothetical protein PS850_06207 [Pseudomonas fluorescens]